IDLQEVDEMHSDGALLDAEEVEFENLSGEDDESVLSEISCQESSGEGIDRSTTASGDDEVVAEQSEGELEYEEDEDRLCEVSSGELDDLAITSNTPGSSIRQAQSAASDERYQSYKCGPDVKTSAVTGVGLQELLELIDEKLKAQDESVKSERVVERGAFDRKWRPPRENDAGIAVEQ
ncbi:hypothetical protein CRG98_046602, partial [Punica granatum]